MSEWISCRLADACASIDYGYTASASAAPVGPKFLRITDIVGHPLRWESVPYVDGNIRELERYRLEHEDLVIARTGATTGESYFIQKPPDAVFASYLVRLKIKQSFSPRFFAYWLKSPQFRTYLAGVLGDKSAQPNASASTMTNAPITLPADKGYQHAIASVLGALDDKIELNRRMNETLEAMARAIFKDWFVDFGPTRAKMAMRGEDPQKEGNARAPHLAPDIWSLFPDRLDDEGKPEGWEEKRVEDILELAYGKALKASERTNGPVPVYGSGGITGYHNEALVEGPSVIVGRKGTVGVLYWEDRPFFPIDTVFYVRPKAQLTFCYYHLQTLGLDTMNTDAAVPGLNRNNVYRLSVPWSDDELRTQFDLLAAPLRQRIRANSEEIETLAATRDFLLPKLMSGEVRVKDAKKLVREAT